MDNDFIAYESNEGGAHAKWDRWIAKAQKLAGHDLDGDQETDGYSLDNAVDCFRAGMTVEQYVATLPTQQVKG